MTRYPPSSIISSVLFVICFCLEENKHILPRRSTPPQGGVGVRREYRP